MEPPRPLPRRRPAGSNLVVPGAASCRRRSEEPARHRARQTRSADQRAVDTPTQIAAPARDLRVHCGAAGRSLRRAKFSNGNMYVGKWAGGKPHGQGVYTWGDGSTYTGEFQQGCFHGCGEKVWPCGRWYRGEWKCDVMCGDGEMSWPSGAHYVGRFRKGLFHGKGKRTRPNGDTYVGQFCDGMEEGEGVFHSLEDGWTYSGRWLHGRLYGAGQLLWADKTRYVGDFMNGSRAGHGKLTWPDGSVCEGLWAHGKLVKEEVFTDDDGSLLPEGFLEELLNSPGNGCYVSSAAGLPNISEVNSSVSDAEGAADPKGDLGPELPLVRDEDGVPLEGEAQVLFLSGDRYTGHFKAGRKHGLGMYVYADLVSYRGIWVEDALDGVQHPVAEGTVPIEVRRVQEYAELSPLSSGGSKPVSARCSSSLCTAHGSQRQHAAGDRRAEEQRAVEDVLSVELSALQERAELSGLSSSSSGHSCLTRLSFECDDGDSPAEIPPSIEKSWSMEACGLQEQADVREMSASSSSLSGRSVCSLSS